MTDRKQLLEWIRAMRERDTDQTLTGHSWVSVKHKCVCITVPKNACSRIKLSLHLLDGNDAPEQLGNVHDLGTRLVSFDDESLVEMLTSPEWFRFCFVRNPYDRLLSAYKTQVGNTWNSQYGWLKDDIKTSLGYPLNEEPETLVPFRDFVRYLSSANDRVRHDGHFNVQARVLVPNIVEYDFVGRVETFQADFEEVLQRLKAPPEIVATASEPKNKTNKTYPPAIAYDTELAALVFELYKTDFETFGYDRDYWKHA